MDTRCKVLILNGSPRKNSNTGLALKEMEKIFDEMDVAYEEVCIGNKTISGCRACEYCFSHGKCAINDIVNELADKLMAADGLVVGSPVYYSSPNGTLIACLDRMFESRRNNYAMKVGAAVTCARRGGCATAFDVINKYFTISGMPIASSQYWNDIYGGAAGEGAQDPEGLQTARVLARNMTFLMKSIKLGKEAYGLPETEDRILTNFIR